LKEVYKKYLSILNEEEEDITICFIQSKKISEKDLIKECKNNVKLNKNLTDKNIIRIIYVKNRIINYLVK